MAFFHPGFFWLTNLFGGGTWARILHPFFGVVMFLFFIVWVARVWKDNRVTAVDWQWARHMGDILRNRTDNLPEIGKYNLGQKYLTRTLLVAILLLADLRDLDLAALVCAGIFNRLAQKGRSWSMPFPPSWL